MKIQVLSYFLVSVFLFGLLTEAYVDFRQKIILDEILLVLLIAGLVYTGVSGHVWKESLMGALAGSVLLGLIYVLSKGGMGFGDVKYAGVLGLWTGVPGKRRDGVWRCKIRRGTGIVDRRSGHNCCPVPGVPDWRYSGVNAVYNA